MLHSAAAPLGGLEGIYSPCAPKEACSVRPMMLLPRASMCWPRQLSCTAKARPARLLAGDRIVKQVLHQDGGPLRGCAWLGAGRVHHPIPEPHSAVDAAASRRLCRCPYSCSCWQSALLCWMTQAGRTHSMQTRHKLPAASKAGPLQVPLHDSPALRWPAAGVLCCACL